MSVYTYIVEHVTNPAISVTNEINGGVLKAVMLDDALAKLYEAENFIREIREETKCAQTRYAIDDFMEDGKESK